MKNTNKKILILGIVAVVLVFGIGGAMIGLLANSLKDASDKLDEAFGDLQGAETSPSEDSNTEDSSTETVPSDDTKLTYAEGEIKTGVRVNNKGFSVYLFYCDGLKANTKYKISWSVDSIYEAYGFYIAHEAFDEVQKPYLSISTDPNLSNLHYVFSSNGSLLYIINNSHVFETNASGYVELQLLSSNDSTNETASARLDAFKQLINYVEIEEVV